jgi:parallel beta-helix repeat protein
MRKSAALLLVLIFLAASCTVVAKPVKAQYQGDITIKADGSVNPSTAPIERLGTSYILTSNVAGNIAVKTNNIVFAGNGHTITGILRIGSLPTAPTAGISYTSNVTIENFTVTGSYYGILLTQTSNVIVANNTITGTGNGILALGEPTAAIAVEGGGSNVITGNIIANNYNAMLFLETENNLIVGNNITNNKNPYVTVSNVMFWGASHNTIYHNNFIGDSSLAGNAAFNSPYSVNVWDNGYPSGGNYWSDYQKRYPSATEIDGSGIGNTSYVVDGQNIDRYPLMEPYTETTYLLQTTPPKISVLNQTFTDSNVSLTFTVDKIVNWTGYSLDGQQNVTITGNTTLTGLFSGLHNVTVYANDTYGNMGASETATFTVAVPEPFPTTLVAVASVASAGIIAAVGLLLYFKKRRH